MRLVFLERLGMVQDFDDDQSSDMGVIRLKAARYVRMSTEHQQYSTENQSDKIIQTTWARFVETDHANHQQQMWVP